LKNLSRYIKLVEVYSDIAGRKNGARFGIDALMKSCEDVNSRYFKQYNAEVILDENRAFNTKSEYTHAKYIDRIYKVISRVAQRIKALKEENLFPIVISGDHASCAGVMHGLKMSNPNDEIGVVYIDAHADIHSPYTTLSGNMHGMPLAIACALDNKEYKVNRLSKDEVLYWEKLKQLAGFTQSINPKNVVFCALRDYENAEDNIINKYGMKKYKSEEITYFGIKTIVEKIFDDLKNCKHIYVSFDVDSIDPLFIPGTGTPSQNGLSFEQALQLNMQLIKNEKVCCWEISEINPKLDKDKVGGKYLFKIIEQVTKMLIKNY
jgi:arginase